MDHSMMNHTGHHHMMNHTGHNMMNHDMHGNHSMHQHHQNHDVDHNIHAHHSSGSSHSMQMFFYASMKATILFEQWTTSSVIGMFGSCVAVFVMAALYEGLKVFREQLLRKSHVTVRYSSMAIPTSAENADNTNSTSMTQAHKTVGITMLSTPHLVQTLLHVLQVVTSYFLMLIFMTFNVWLCLAVALGAGCGYFLFSWKRAIVVDVNEHCH